MSRDVSEGDVFAYNGAFSSRFYRVKIGTVSAQRESEPEKAETRQKVRTSAAGSSLWCRRSSASPLLWDSADIITWRALSNQLATSTL